MTEEIYLLHKVTCSVCKEEKYQYDLSLKRKTLCKRCCNDKTREIKNRRFGKGISERKWNHWDFK
jgi:hypothetical protein